MTQRIDHEAHITQAKKLCLDWEDVSGMGPAIKVVKDTIKRQRDSFSLEEAKRRLQYLSAQVGPVLLALDALAMLPHATAQHVALEIVRAGRHMISVIPEDRKNHHPNPEALTLYDALEEIVKRRGEHFSLKDAKHELTKLSAHLQIMGNFLKITP